MISSSLNPRRARPDPRCCAALAVALLTMGCASNSSERLWREAPHYDLGAIAIALLPSPASPREGDNALRILVRRRDGTPPRGVNLWVIASMPAMGTMPYMESRARAEELRPGLFRARYSLSMSGAWDLELVAASRESGEIRGHWHIQTGIPGFRYVEETAPVTDVTLGPRAPADSVGPSGAGAASAASVWIEPGTWRQVGLEVAPVLAHPLISSFAILGQVEFDETHSAELSMRISGRVRRLMPVQVGSMVRKRQVLCTAYSPEMIAAQQEFLNTLYSLRSRGADMNAEPHMVADAVSAARSRLAGWDLPQQAIDSIQRSYQLIQEFDIQAPITGVITQKSIVQGSYFTPGSVLFRISPTDPIRVIASLPESEQAFAHLGAPVEIWPPAASSPRTGKVLAVGPSLDERTRTLQVSVSCRNPGNEMRAGEFVRVRFARALGEGIGLPESAILRSSRGAQVCVETSRGRFELREVDLGALAGDGVEIRRGLLPGERVATKGAFLIAAQLQLSRANRP